MAGRSRTRRDQAAESPSAVSTVWASRRVVERVVVCCDSSERWAGEDVVGRPIAAGGSEGLDGRRGVGWRGMTDDRGGALRRTTGQAGYETQANP